MALAVSLLILLAFSWRLGALGGDRAERRHAAAVARRWGLPSESVDATFVRRIARRQRFVQAGVLLGIVVMTFVPDSSIVALYGGLAVGAVADQLAVPRLPPGTPRVAHAIEPRLSDYVPAWVLGAAALGAACGPALAVLWAVLPHNGPPRSPSTAGTVALALASVAGLAASLALARFVIRRPQAAGSPAQLAVADGLRAQAVRDALHVTAVVSLVTTLALGLKEQEVGEPLGHAGGLVTVVVIVGLLLTPLVHEFTGGPRHWRRRLHPVQA